MPGDGKTPGYIIWNLHSSWRLSWCHLKISKTLTQMNSICSLFSHECPTIFQHSSTIFPPNGLEIEKKVLSWFSPRNIQQIVLKHEHIILRRGQINSNCFIISRIIIIIFVYLLLCDVNWLVKDNPGHRFVARWRRGGAFFCVPFFKGAGLHVEGDK